MLTNTATSKLCHIPHDEIAIPTGCIAPVLIAEQGDGAILISESTPYDKMEREAAEAERKAIMQDVRNLQKRIWCFENSFGVNQTKCGNAREFLHHANEQIQQC